MFVPRAIWEAFSKLHDAHIASAKNFAGLQADQLERTLARVLAAKDSEVAAIVTAKDEQVKFLRAECDRLLGLVKHERDRAEAAIDQRLIAAAGEPVRHADLQRALAEKEVEGLTPEKTKEAKAKSVTLDQIMAQVNSVVEDAGEEAADERLVSIGGQPVSHT